MSNYYEINANKYIEDTINCDMSNLYEFFLKYIPNNGTILDLGFRSGRDIINFTNKGYIVKGIDPASIFVKLMKEKRYNVEELDAQSMNYINEFDGIWACSSLLHVPTNELNLAFKNCAKALKNNGYMYCSFKYGEFEGERNGRVFTDLTENNILQYLEGTNLEIIETKTTIDVRPDREDKWLNCILKTKVDTNYMG